MTLSRRSLVRGSAALALTWPLAARAATPWPREVDIVVVGAGAAGIAAARHIMASGRTVLVLEAAARLGGRCHTDTTTFGVPFDRGARWLHDPDGSPIVRHAREAGLTLAPAPRGQKIRIGRRNARAGEAEEFLATLVRANRALDAAARGKTDVAAAAALPGDLGVWEATARFVLGVLRTSKDLDQVSAIDRERMARRLTSLVCREGVGALLARLGGQVPVALSTPARQIHWGGRRPAEVETPDGRITARAVIVTVSTAMLNAAEDLRFVPDLPQRPREAAARLSLGHLERIAIELPGNPLGLATNDIVIERSTSRQTGLLLANVDGSALCTVDVGGAFARDLSAGGEAAMVAFATDWLAGLFGSGIRDKLGRSTATRWGLDPFIRGALSAAAPGGATARRILAEPLQNLFLAGEACHETLGGTVAGAWDSGEQAAAAALKAIGPARPPAPAKRPTKRGRAKR
jgi:monoamine oxidase